MTACRLQLGIIRPKLHRERQVPRFPALECLPHQLPCSLSQKLQHVCTTRDVGHQERSQAAQLQYRKNESKHVGLGHQGGIQRQKQGGEVHRSER